MNIWAVANSAFLLEKKFLVWSDAHVSLVVQAVEESLDNYSKYPEGMEHLMRFDDLIMGRRLDQALRVASPWCNTFSSPSKWEIYIEYLENLELYLGSLYSGVIFKVDRLG